MANFNDFNDVRAWLTQHDLALLRTSLNDGSLRGKTLEVACAYIEHANEYGYDVTQAHHDESSDLKWEWHPWRIVVVALFFAGPPSLVWVILSLSN